MSIDWGVSFDPGSLAELVRLRGFSILLDPEITAALKQAADLLVTTARANTYQVFDNPTGVLEQSIYPYVVSPSEIAVRVGVDYGHRREYSFYGPDSLGRVYPNDIPRPYLEPALEEDRDLIALMMEVAVNKALDRVAVI